MATSLIHNSHDDFSDSGAQHYFSNINPVLKRQLNSFAGCCR
jgi:hypothetical protein